MRTHKKYTSAIMLFFYRSIVFKSNKMKYGFGRINISNYIIYKKTCKNHNNYLMMLTKETTMTSSFLEFSIRIVKNQTIKI